MSENHSPAVSAPSRLQTWRVKVGLFGCFVVAGGIAVKLRDIAWDLNPQSGVVNSWASFWIVAAITTFGAWIGAALGVALGGRLWGGLIAVTMGAISASMANPHCGAVWGLAVGAMVIGTSARATAKFLGVTSLAAIYGFAAAAVARDQIIGAPSRWFAALGAVAFGAGVQSWLLIRLWPSKSDLLKSNWDFQPFAGSLLVAAITWYCGWSYGLSRRVDGLAKNGQIVVVNPTTNGSLSITLKDPTSNDLATLRCMPGSVHKAEISGPTLDDQRIHELPALTHARSVTIHNTSLTGEVLPAWIQLQHAQDLEIRDTPITDTGLLALVGRSVASGRLGSLSLHKTQVTAAGVVNLFALKAQNPVNDLLVTSSGFSDSDVAELSKLPIQTLTLDCPRVTPQGLAELSSSANLQFLGVWLTELSAPHIDVLAELQRKRRKLIVHVQMGKGPVPRSSWMRDFRRRSYTVALHLDHDSSVEELTEVLLALEPENADVSITAPSSWKDVIQALQSRFRAFAVTYVSDADTPKQRLAFSSSVYPRTGLLAHWPLAGDTQDRSGNGYHAVVHGAVDLEAAGPNGAAKTAAGFNGRDAWLEIPAAHAPDLLGTRFSIAAWVYAEDRTDDVPGDIISRYSPEGRRGFHLSLKSNAVTNSFANTRHLHFGIDADLAGEWLDCGTPGNALLAFSMAVHAGNLYVGTCEPGAGESGRVYRYQGPQQWIDLGAPNASNCITALTVYDGQLYAGTGKYRLAGSALPESSNTTLGGRVLRYTGSEWIDCGQLPATEAIGGLAVFRGQLYATSLYRPAGFYRYGGTNTWVDAGTPDGKRVNSMAVYNGHLYATSYDGGHVYRFDGTSWTDCGQLGENTQTYSFAVYQGRLYVGTWPSGRVYRFEDVEQWTDVGRLGEELEVMGMLVHNGRLLAGTLPLAEVYSYEGETDWKRLATLDQTPDVKYRRAWTMAEHEGQLFCSTLPSGKIYRFEVGRNLMWGQTLSAGWHHVAAVKDGQRLALYVDGTCVSESTSGSELPLLSNLEDVPLRIGFGANDYFLGRVADLRLYRRDLRPDEVRQLFTRRGE